MQYFDTETGERLREAFERTVLQWQGTTRSAMFGCPAYQARGTLFALLVTDGVALTRLTPDQYDRLDEEFGTGPFRAGEWRITKWSQVTVDRVTELEDLLPFVEMSYEQALDEGEW